jgi:hypothetical protein
MDDYHNSGLMDPQDPILPQDEVVVFVIRDTGYLVAKTRDGFNVKLLERWAFTLEIDEHAW